MAEGHADVKDYSRPMSQGQVVGTIRSLRNNFPIAAAMSRWGVRAEGKDLALY